MPATLRAFLLPYAGYFRERGWRVDAAASDVSSCDACREAFGQVFDVAWSRNPRDPRNLGRAPGQIRDLVLSNDYDLVHVHTPVAALVTRLALRRLRARGRPKLIYTAHGFHFYRGGPPLKNTVFLTLEKLCGTWTDYLVVINREDEEAARRYRLVPPERLRYMPGIGIDLAHYHPDRVSEAEVRNVHAEFGLGPEDRLLLMIAAMDPGKRHRDALAALARLGRPEVKLAFAGDGELLGEMQQLAATLGVREQTRFLGRRSDIPALLKASEALLLPSEREGLPRSIMEALAMGTPVIGTRIRGVVDMLADDCGLMTEVGDVAGISAAMARVLDHPEEAAGMARRGRERATAYELPGLISLHETLYRQAGQAPLQAESLAAT